MIFAWYMSCVWHQRYLRSKFVLSIDDYGYESLNASVSVCKSHDEIHWRRWNHIFHLSVPVSKDHNEKPRDHTCNHKRLRKDRSRRFRCGRTCRQCSLRRRSNYRSRSCIIAATTPQTWCCFRNKRPWRYSLFFTKLLRGRSRLHQNHFSNHRQF